MHRARIAVVIALAGCAAPGDGSSAADVASDVSADVATDVTTDVGPETSPETQPADTTPVVPDVAPDTTPDVPATCAPGTYPTSGGRCLGASVICQEAALNCGSDAVCEVWAPRCDEAGCRCEANGNPVVPECVCRHTGFVFDGAACQPDLSACRAIDACDAFRYGYQPIAYEDRWFDITASGDLAFTLVDEWHSDFYWDSDGTMRLYYNWYAKHCGSVGFSIGEVDAVEPGVYALPDAQMSLGVSYGERWDPLESTCRHASLSIL